MEKEDASRNKEGSSSRCGYWLLLALPLFLAGCATPVQKPLPRTGDPIVDGQTYIEQGPAKDRVLWQYRTAAAAMRRGQLDLAKRLLDDAILTMGGIITDDKSARRARSLFSAESRKTFIGEPYERVMAYYYRGILYWMDGEPDNARACFRSGQFLDSDAENKEYAADYVLLEYLDALATAKLGGDGSDALKRAQEFARTDRLPELDPKENVLFFAEFGTGPTKYAVGAEAEQLRFKAGTSPTRSARITIEGQKLPIRAYDDLSFQATTRGGRVMDHVLANKAVFKEATSTAGDAAIIAGAVMASQQGRGSSVDEAGLGLLAAGLIAKVLSAATTPMADTRTWDNLPQLLGFGAIQLPPGQHPATVEFLDPGGRPIPGLAKSVTINVDASKDTVVFISDRK